jgi:hypothetical protein
MSSTRQLLIDHNLEDLFTIVYTVTDDYIAQSIRAGRFTLPEMKNQKASYSELMTIALVGEILHEVHAGTWFLLVRRFGQHLFQKLPDITRYYRIMRNLERIWADLSLCLANTVDDDTTYSIDSKPIAI